MTISSVCTRERKSSVINTLHKARRFPSRLPRQSLVCLYVPEHFAHVFQIHITRVLPAFAGRTLYYFREFAMSDICFVSSSPFTSSERRIIDCAVRTLEKYLRKTGEAFTTSEYAKDWVRLQFANLDREVFTVLYLDNQNRFLIKKYFFWERLITQKFTHVKSLKEPCVITLLPSFWLTITHPDTRHPVSLIRQLPTRSFRHWRYWKYGCLIISLSVLTMFYPLPSTD